MATEKKIELSKYYVKQQGWDNNKNVVTSSEGKISVDNMPSIPTDTSDLTNGANFTTATGHNHDNRYYTETEIDNKLLEKADASAVDDIVTGDVELTNYYTKTEINTKVNEKANLIHNHDDKYYTETEIDTKIQTINNNITNAISNLELIEIVQDLPTTNIKTNKLYLKTNGNTTNENKYDIYIRTINNEWEKIDSLDFTITDYIKKTNNNTDLLLANGEKIPQSTFLTTHNPVDSSLDENSPNALQNQAINTELNKKENISNKIKSTNGSISSGTDEQYPSAKLVNNTLLQMRSGIIDALADKEDTENRTQVVSSSSTPNQYPSAKAIYDYAQPKGSYLTKTNNDNIILGNGSSISQNTFALAHDHPYLSSGEGSVTSRNIVNGTIKDEDIADNAGISFSKLNGVAASGHDHNGVYQPIGDYLTTNSQINVNKITGLATVSTTGSYKSLSNTPIITKITPMNDISEFKENYEQNINEGCFIIIELRDLNNNLVKNTNVDVIVDKGYFLRKGDLEWDNENDCYIGSFYEGGLNSKSVTVNTGNYGYGLLQYIASESGIITFEANNSRAQMIIHGEPELIERGWDSNYGQNGGYRYTYYVFKESRTVQFKCNTGTVTFTKKGNDDSASYILSETVPEGYKPITAITLPCLNADAVLQIASNGTMTAYASRELGSPVSRVINCGGTWQY